MTPLNLSLLICRGVGLFFLVAGLAATLPDLLFNPFYDWTVFSSPQEMRGGGLATLFRSHAGHVILSNVLQVFFGILLLVFSRRISRWLAVGASAPAA